MSIAVSTIESLISQYPLGFMDLHQWYADHPTDTDPFFGIGSFAGGDLPFGIAYELHDIPSTEGHDWTESIVYPNPLGKLVNNVSLHVGMGSALPIEEFFLNRPRGLLTFHEPSTTSIVLELRDGVTAKIWGLYLPIPFVTPTQMTWTPVTPAPTLAPSTYDGFAWGTVTGDGALSLGPGTVGVRVDITALPPSRGREAGTPITYWDLGWINWSDGDGFRSREFIEGASWESRPVQPQSARVLAYSLTAGVEATFTQLLQTDGHYL
jgi:hypothetical protein